MAAATEVVKVELGQCAMTFRFRMCRSILRHRRLYSLLDTEGGIFGLGGVADKSAQILVLVESVE